jgi:hypothetical protein
VSAIAERFQRDTAKHRMIVLHDDGPYRHVRFMEHRFCNDAEYRPNSSFYWFDLITWPGCLTISGDCGTYTFAREQDMFGFFRMHRDRTSINPSYWAEKVKAQDSQATVTGYSEDLFREHVVDYVTEAIRYGGAPRGIGKAVREEIFGEFAKWDITQEHGAQAALAEFEYGTTYTAGCICKARAEGLSDSDAHRWRRDHAGKGHQAEVTRVEGFRFHDAWEWDLRDYGWQYLWCCHAIVWGIAQYDAATAVTT